MGELRDPQLTVLWMEGRTYRRFERVAPHHHGFNQLQVILNGEVHVTLGQQRVTVCHNQLYLTLPGVTHSFWFNQDSVLIDIKFSASGEFQRLLDQTSATPVFQIPHIDWFRQLLVQAMRAQEQPQATAMLSLDVRLKDLLLRLLAAPVTPMAISATRYLETNPDFAPLRYLQRHYHEPMTLENLAEHFHYSKNYMIRICKHATGTTPNVLLQLIRLRHAERYLEYSDLSVGAIAIRVGLDANYLTRLFKQRVGISPLQYRKNSRSTRQQNVTLMHSFNWRQQPTIQKESRPRQHRGK